ncbi:ATP-binding protein [Actomonas aquatica]|uniref:histidine kinase n=1 Tax=Actomonas aquatica TaxID=2866162 RepID=A0ABZ1C2J8_9BACT|nr:ATP-binding protein [Opitutus sp. WL0086]WRQ85686.1 ATP-binding protein [Opitutus sp. WL0086]
MTRILPTRNWFRRSRCLLLLGLTAAAASLRAQEITPSLDQANATRIARSTAEFWLLASENPDIPLAYDIECDVTYYNPAWNLMWVQSGPTGEYAIPGSQPRTIRSGDRVRFRGTMPPPVTNFDLSTATTEVIGPSRAPVLPLPAPSLENRHLRNHLVSFEAWVDKQSPIDDEFMRLTFSYLGATINATVSLQAADYPLPVLVDRRVRVQGVFAPRIDPTGANSELQVMIPGLAQITTVGWVGDDPRFEVPIRAIADLPNLPVGTAVRLEGEMIHQNTGRSLTVRDDSGQITLESAQLRYLRRQDPIALVGEVVESEGQHTLQHVMFRRGFAPLSSDQQAAHPEHARRLLNLAARVRELPEAELTHGHQANLRGVVSWSHPNVAHYFLQDASGGLQILRGPGNPFYAPGTNLEVRGEVQPGDFAPVLAEQDVEDVGAMAYPQPRELSLEDALSGAHDAQWASLRGYVYAVSRDDGICTLHASTPHGDFAVHMVSPRPRRDLLHAVIEAQGVLQAIASPDRQLTGVQLWVPEPHLLKNLDAAPADPFDPPTLSIARLGRFNPGADMSNFVNVTGTVLAHLPNGWLYLSDGDAVIRVHTRETLTFPRGRRLEVAGRLGRDHGDVVLREALLRPLGVGELPAACALPSEPSELTRFEGRLVQLHGTVLTAASARDYVRLTVAQGPLVLDAQLKFHPADRPSDIDAWTQPGAHVELTGVLLPAATEARTSSLALRLSEPADIVLRQTAPWLTTNRLTNIALSLVIVLGLGILWVRVLRRRVRSQTFRIKEQIERESHLNEELQKATRLESLGLLAGGIAHDFNNLLTVVLGNLSLLRLDIPRGSDADDNLSEAERAISRAQQLTLQLLTFAKGGTPVRHAEALPDIVSEVTQFALHGTSVRCDLQVADKLWPAHVDKGQISQVVQNLTINAVQAMPRGGRLEVSLANAGPDTPRPPTVFPQPYVRLRITDSGMGIPANQLPRIFDPYFSTKSDGHGLGLATVYSIVRKHHGDIEVESVEGLGTTFTIWLPAAVQTPTADETLTNDSAMPSASIPPETRILLMDDEPSIRTVASRILQHLGYHPEAVVDGDEAITAFRTAQAEGKPFAAVVLDLTIRGGKGGLETLAALRSLDPAVKAVVSSGYSSDPAAASYRDLGFDDRIPKPYEIATIDRVLRKVLEASEPAVTASPA